MTKTKGIKIETDADVSVNINFLLSNSAKSKYYSGAYLFPRISRKADAMQQKKAQITKP